MKVLKSNSAIEFLVIGYIVLSILLFISIILPMTEGGNRFWTIFFTLMIIPWYFGSGNGAYYIIEEDDKIIIKNVFLFWIKTPILFSSIEKVNVGEGRVGNYLSIWQAGQKKDYGVSIKKEDLKALILRMKAKNIEAFDSF